MNRPALLLAGAGLLVLTGIFAASQANQDGRTADLVITRPVAAPHVDQLAVASRATGVPRRALQAYVGAARQLQVDQPTCGLAWNTLAGIGAAESSHGAFGGARLGKDGVASPRIIGVPLDGTQGNRAIRDTDGGVLDGDTTWDRAVGPLQFIPTTWERWGASADGGKPDPHNIDDAALAAGRYLCDSGTDLTTSEGWSRAVLSYNHSGSYARKISATATAYAEAL